MSWLLRHWNRFWFEPTGPVDLAAARFLLFGLVLSFHVRFFDAHAFAPWADVPSVFWMPVSFFGTFGIGPLSGPALELLNAVWLVSIAASCIGLFTRPAVIVVLFTSLYLVGLPHNFGKVHHADALLVLMMGAFAFSRCGDAFSLDAVIRRRWGRRRGPGTPSAADDAAADGRSSEYTWPLRLCWVLWSLMFFAAGVAKLRASGLEWIFSDNMAIHLVRHQFTHAPLIDIGPVLAGVAWIPPLIAAATIVLEVGAPLALFSRTARCIIVPGLLLTQMGIWILLGVSFRQMFAAYVVWVPFAAIAAEARVPAMVTGSPPETARNDPLVTRSSRR